ncbi:zinc-finger domain-containing protein [Planococcus sp. CP5-4]|uniref:zinc-finger domain-containing protein n=1 Tax=unclassified Planococcus (in: firmicutes) TaxID=2662419 RepID=UPI001C224D39|nr:MULTISPECIES: zinc-finger domain-containing protein [unclassified Planococcus (in: firmicutes)]MBU9674786.1 zinc-finger domain-containing protein [Planococcus sp. CP5-4_YE]MBV0910581.1 zinc-finger domain-containing protein [Planococcus sp. CP5-4_UN]MBW6065388.1 zinc-finger domain-containing protein [Planococcus sp. CP5-4]
MKKVSIINEIDEILNTYCEGCFVKAQLRKDEGKTAAHRFCISECTVGTQLQFLGQELNKIGTDKK